MSIKNVGYAAHSRPLPIIFFNELKTKVQDFATVYFGYGINRSGLTDSQYLTQKERLKDIFKAENADETLLKEAFLVASFAGHKSMVKRLLKKGAQDSQAQPELLGEEYNGFNSSLLATMGSAGRIFRDYKRAKTVEVLDKKCLRRSLRDRDALNNKRKAEAQALKMACEQKDIWALAQLNPSVDAIYAIMLSAIQDGNTEVLSYLKDQIGLEKIASALKLRKNLDVPESCYTHFQTLLVYVVNQGKLERIEWLLENGAVDLQDAFYTAMNNRTPNYEIIRLLATKLEERGLLNDSLGRNIASYRGTPLDVLRQLFLPVSDNYLCRWPLHRIAA